MPTESHVQSADYIAKERGESTGGIASRGNYFGTVCTADELRSTEGIS